MESITLDVNILRKNFNSGQLKLIGIDSFDYVENSSTKVYKITDNLYRGAGEGFCFIIWKNLENPHADKSENVICIANEYEMFNPFIFKSVVILPGRDSVTAIDINTLEYKTQNIS